MLAVPVCGTGTSVSVSLSVVQCYSAKGAEGSAGETVPFTTLVDGEEQHAGVFALGQMGPRDAPSESGARREPRDKHDATER